MDIDITHDRKVLKILKRRLRKRELQAATYGISADPSINIEIEDLRKEIKSMEWKIARRTANVAENRREYLADLPKNLEDNISVVKFNLHGNWKLQEIYDFGSTNADVRLMQDGSRLWGTMTIQDSMDDGEEMIIEEHFSGTIRERTMFLYGEHIVTISGRTDDYELDQWIGIIKDTNTIEGNSEDIDGTTGKFIMERKY